MTMRKTLLAIVFAALIVPLSLSGEETDLILARAWPYAPYARLTELGTGVGIVFSPDLSVRGNCRFYQALGFACFEDTDWSRVLNGIHEFNTANPDRPIRTLILETHGTNGNGLKLQKSYDPDVDRSYISVGALQERLDPEGVRYVIISACNSGRLLRPEIYNNLDPDNGDKLFLPATRGIIGASSDYDPALSGVTIVTPASSHREMTIVGNVRELSAPARRALSRSAASLGIDKPQEFAVSDLLMQMVMHSRALRLRIGGGADPFSEKQTSASVSEALYGTFLRRLNALARREPQTSSALGATR